MAHAQIPSQAEPEEVTIRPAVEARRVMLSFSKCLVNKARFKVVAFLAITPGSDESKAVGIRLADPDCLQAYLNREDHLSFKPLLLRGGLYTALYSSEFAKAAPTIGPGDAVPMLPSPPNATTQEVAAVALSHFGVCVARANPSAARALTLAQPGKTEETQAVAALIPAASACVIEGQQLRFSKDIMRAAVAEGIYRLSQQAAATAQRR